MRARFLLLLPPLFITGAAVLAQEVLWMRAMRRLIGSTSGTAALVLAGVLGGMALGSWLGEGALLRARRPTVGWMFRAWAVASLASGAAALLLWGVLGAIDGLDSLPPGTGALLLVLLLGASIPPGAGFPLAVAALGEPSPSRAGALYGMGSLGGALGALATPLFLLGALGEGGTLILSASLQVAVGAGVAVLSPITRFGGETLCALRSAGRAAHGGAGPEELWRIFPVVFLSGLAVTCWELLWLRILVLVVGSSIYAFATVAGGVVLGIGVGSLLLQGSGAGRLGQLLPMIVLALLAAAYFAVPYLPEVYLLGARAFPGWSHWWGGSVAGGVVLVGCAPLGLLYPWALARSPLRAGSLAAASGVGAAAGALLGGPDFLGRLGLEQAYLGGLVAAGAVAACGALADREAGRRFWWLAFSCAAIVPGALASIRPVCGWDLPRLLSGVYQWPLEYLSTRPLEREVLVTEEGCEAIVSVERDSSTVYVKSNGKVEGSVPLEPGQASLADLPTQGLLGTLPALLLPGGAAGIIGLGSGTTLGAAVRAGLGEIDLLEIEPAFERALTAPRAAHYFAPYLRGALESPHVRRFTGDARGLLGGPLRGRRWDVLVSQPSEPWTASSAPLFTREFFQKAGSRLSSQGIFFQWVQLYKLPRPALEMLVRTFRQTFERVFVVRPPGTGELILVGAQKPLELGALLGRAARLQETAPDLITSMGVQEPLDFLASFLLGPDGVDGWVGSGLEIHSDDRPRLEVLAPAFFHQGKDLASANLLFIQKRGRGDPIARYLPPALRAPETLRRLASRNIRVGDFWEALGTLEGDDSLEAKALRREAEREIAALPDSGGAREGER